jgi:O-antigen/teichoic acid export membrane protein
MSSENKKQGGLLGKGVLGGVIKLSGVGLGFLFFLFVARLTSAEQYGYFATAFSSATILGFAATGGQHVSVLRFWPALSGAYNEATAEAALWPTFRLVLGLSLLVLVLGGAYAAYLLLVADDPGLAGIVFFGGVLAASFALSEYSVAALRARGMMVYSLGPREILWRVLACAALFWFAAPMSASTALAISAGTLLAATLPQLTYLTARMLQAEKTALPGVERGHIQQAILGLWRVAIAMPITQHATTVVVAVTLGPVAAGAYFAADKLARLLIIGMYGINQVAGPRLSRAYHSGDIATCQSIASSASTIAVLAAIVGFVGYAVLGVMMLGLFDPGYVFAYPVLLVLALGAVINAMSGVNELLLQLVGQERRYFWVIVGWGFGALALSYVMAILFGPIGAGIATMLGIAGRSLHAVYLCKRDVGILTLPSWPRR